MRANRRLLQFEQPLQPPNRLLWSGASGGCNRSASRLLQILGSFLKVPINRSSDQFSERSTRLVGQLLQLLNLLFFQEEGCPLHDHIVPHVCLYGNRPKVPDRFLGKCISCFLQARSECAVIHFWLFNFAHVVCGQF
jgi:hypothetical protein